MGWFKGAGKRRLRWALVALGLLSTGCAGFIGAGATAVLVGAGVVAFACYDRVAVTVTDGVTGTPLCDARVTFRQGKSETEATSCYQAALSEGKYTLRVERPGLVPFEEPVEVTKGGNCGQTVQTVYVALDRKDAVTGPRQVAPAPERVGAPRHAASPAAPVAAPPGTVSSATPAAPPNAVPSALPPPPPAPSAPATAPSAQRPGVAFPDAP